MKKMLLVVSLIFVLLLSCNIAFAGAQDFTLVNNTGRIISYVYISPSNVNDWQEDVMDRDILPNGESVDISFEETEQTTFWDLKVVFSDHGSKSWTKINLKEISKITLKSNGKAVYE